ncbi:PH domain-containing protein [Empedobacter falsenii]|uniref:PH domain-containing protein n=1 Tax=Empedobacter sp. TaxID=1927715 RepID=UPI002898F8AA|nr:PH domain-containing protein [Empedobacter sp.]
MENLLTKNDKMEYNIPIKYQAKIHWISYIMPIISIIIGSLGIPFVLNEPMSVFGIIGWCFIFLMLKGIYKIYFHKRTLIYITDKYITISKGIFTTSTIDTPLEKLEGLTLYQSFLGKILKFGTLTITTGEFTTYYKIADPIEFRKNLLVNNNS